MTLENKLKREAGIKWYQKDWAFMIGFSIVLMALILLSAWGGNVR